MLSAIAVRCVLGLLLLVIYMSQIYLGMISTPVRFYILHDHVNFSLCWNVQGVQKVTVQWY